MRKKKVLQVHSAADGLVRIAGQGSRTRSASVSFEGREVHALHYCDQPGAAVYLKMSAPWPSVLQQCCSSVVAGRGGRKTNRRVIANRQSAQRSRMRKLQYISDLEANVAGLQNDLNEMQPQVALVQSRHASALLATGPEMQPPPRGGDLLRPRHKCFCCCTMALSCLLPGFGYLCARTSRNAVHQVLRHDHVRGRHSRCASLLT